MLLLDENQEVLTLVTNSLKKYARKQVVHPPNTPPFQKLTLTAT